MHRRQPKIITPSLAHGLPNIKNIRTEPLPKMPDIMHQAKLEITVPGEFFLR